MERLYKIDKSGEKYFDIEMNEKGKLLVSVALDDFYGRSEFSQSRQVLYRMVLELKSFKSEPAGAEYRLSDSESDAYILFTKQSRGVLDIHGQLGSKFKNAHLCFKLAADLDIMVKLAERIESQLNKNK